MAATRTLLPAAAPPERPDGPSFGLRAVVVGGGVAGLTAARALLDAGSDVAVFERRSLEEMLSGPSGLSISPNALSALALLSGSTAGASLAHDVIAAGAPTPIFSVTTPAGRELSRLGSIPADGGVPLEELAIGIARPALQRTLHGALPPGAVTCGACFRSLRHLEDGRVEASFVLEDGSEHTETCDLLVGADGIRSAVRACLEEQNKWEPQAPVFSGYGYFRGMVDLNKWPGGVEAWEGAMGPSLTMAYGCHGASAVFQVSPTRVCFGRYCPCAPGEFHRQAKAMGPREAKAKLQELCQGWGVLQELAALADPDAVAIGELWSLPPAKGVWGAGCVTLAGDAAHAMLPALGQGACQGIEDGVEMAGMLHRATASKAAGGGEAPLSATEVAAVLRRFEAARGQHTARVRKQADTAFATSVGGSWWVRFKRDCTFRLLPQWIMMAAFRYFAQRRFSWGAPPVVA